MVVKTSPIKKFKRIDLESCLNPIKGQMVFPDNPQYFQDITDENTLQTLFDTINELGQTLTDDITFLVNLNATYLQLNGVYLGTEENAQIVMKNFTSLSKPNSTYYYEETFFSSVVRWSGVTEEGVINPVLQPRTSAI
ncbi:24460_t:CDS:2 [Dentiscutata erythropus]|uniref:24460_t:CDS:1 n=1 Tax=Dentiscutata erythropus TaxID=1348616 RepID=A0A9N9DAE4_9GLOM|nr:24460_t:CDS:2 [Dentiscutata erythropus]